MFLDILKIHGIEESSVYQTIYAKGYAEGFAKGYAKGIAKGYAEGFAKGRTEAAREILIRHSRREWGEPDERVLSQIMAIDDLEPLHDLIDRVFDESASSWDDLLPPAASSV